MRLSDDSHLSPLRIDVSDIQYLSEKQIRREVRRSAQWVKAHAPLMPGCDYTPTGFRRVPRAAVRWFVLNHDPATCSACPSLSHQASSSGGPS